MLSAMLQKKSVLIVLLAAGLLLLLWPRSSGSGTAGKNEDVSTTEEKRLCAVAEEPNRRGECTGAVVVCSGARSPDIRLRVIQAVSAFTGLGSDRIIVEELIS